MDDAQSLDSALHAKELTNNMLPISAAAAVAALPNSNDSSLTGVNEQRSKFHVIKKEEGVVDFSDKNKNNLLEGAVNVKREDVNRNANGGRDENSRGYGHDGFRGYEYGRHGSSGSRRGRQRSHISSWQPPQQQHHPQLPNHQVQHLQHSYQPQQYLPPHLLQPYAQQRQPMYAQQQMQMPTHHHQQHYNTLGTDIAGGGLQHHPQLPNHQVQHLQHLYPPPQYLPPHLLQHYAQQQQPMYAQQQMQMSQTLQSGNTGTHHHHAPHCTLGFDIAGGGLQHFPPTPNQTPNHQLQYLPQYPPQQYPPLQPYTQQPMCAQLQNNFTCHMKVTHGLDRFGKPYVEQRSSDSLVRLQNYVDEDIPSDRAQLWNKILDNVDAKEDNVELYPRSWKSTSSQQNGGNVEERIEESDGDSSSYFTVAQFNTLAKGLSSGPNNLFPIPFETASEGSYGGFTELTKPEVILDFNNFRKWRLLEVILGGEDACITGDGSRLKMPALFDILALEEVDEYHSFFEPILVKDGCYCGIYQPKPYSPCVRFGWYSDGVALLWKREKFKAIDKCIDANGNSETWVVKGSFAGGAEYRDQVYIIVPLQIKGTDKCIVVAATHLKAKKGVTKGVPNEEIRLSQSAEVRRRSEQMADQLKDLGWKEVSIIILGDFNTEPGSLPVTSILREKGDWKFRSAYANNNDDSYTTWKTRKSGTTRRVIDYIFHTGDDGLQCKEVLSIPNDEVLERTYLPGFRYPSDHLLIAAKFHAVMSRRNDQLPEAASSLLHQEAI